MTPLMPSGVLVPRIAPGNPEWLQVMSASKIAAVMGLSPWESRFSLYHRMTGLVGDGADDSTRRGHYLEDGVLAWFADQHPDWQIAKTGTWLHSERKWQAATPDSIVTLPDGTTELVEAKTHAELDKWGEAGSDDVPVCYRTQIMWQLDTLGLQRCHLAVLLPFLTFQAYVIDYNEAEAALLRDAAVDFLADIRDGNRPPIDGSDATYEVVRQLHPLISGDDRDIGAELALGYRQACDDHTAAKQRKQLLASEITDLMGSARYATWQGERVAMRVPGRGTNPPFLRPVKATSERDAA
jgi:putative phage-type endonuclease